MIICAILCASVVASILIVFSLILDTCPPVIPSDIDRLKEYIGIMHKKLLILMAVNLILFGIAVYLNDFVFQ